MIEFDITKFKTAPYPYQPDTVRHILKRSAVAIFDEQGVGKSKPVVDAACILFAAHEIEMVIVVAPASVRNVWDDKETGEIAKHSWSDYISIRYDGNFTAKSLPIKSNQLLWITISYSYLRARLDKFLKLVNGAKKPFLLVLDESSYIKSEKAQQSKACWSLRQSAKRCVLLNGTPYANSIMDLWMQFNILEPAAIKHMNYYHYRAKYAILQSETAPQFNRTFQKIVGFREPEVQELKKQLAPYIIRREKADVAKDLPPKLPPVYLEAQMTPEGYRVYTEMEKQMVAWLDEQQYSSSLNAAVKSGRLSQITSGFLGGLQDVSGEMVDDENKIKIIDDAKLKTYLEFREQNPDKQVIVWCRFRAEMFRLQEELTKKGFRPTLFMGGMNEDRRTESKKGFINGLYTDFIGHPLAGGFGITLVNCHTVVYMSMSYSLIQYQQSSDRVHRPGQKFPVSYYYILATSPTGRKLIDHHVVKAVITKEDMAAWTVDQWKTIMKK